MERAVRFLRISVHENLHSNACRFHKGLDRNQADRHHGEQQKRTGLEFRVYDRFLSNPLQISFRCRPELRLLLLRYIV
jgi:hypothetical protein